MTRHSGLLSPVTLELEAVGGEEFPDIVNPGYVAVESLDVSSTNAP